MGVVSTRLIIFIAVLCGFVLWHLGLAQGVPALHKIDNMASEKWKEASIRTIKVAQTLLAQTENDLDNAIATDPLPTIRDRCVRETNRKIHDYARSVRAVVIQLRQCFAAVNTEIKSMNRTKESLYKFLNTIRRLMTINVHSVQLRLERPHREKVYYNIYCIVYHHYNGYYYFIRSYQTMLTSHYSMNINNL